MHTPLATHVASADSIADSVAAEIADKPSPETRRSYEHVWRYYLEWLAAQPLAVTEVRPKHVQRYLASLRDRGLKKGTISRAGTVIRVLYGALVRDEIMPVNPAREVKGPKVDSTPKTPWIRDPADIEKLINVPASTWTERRDYLIVRAAFALGWRRSEIARICVEDIEGEVIFAPKIKGGKSLRVGLPDWLANDIFEWRQFAGIESGPLFRRSEHGDQRQINGAVVYRVVRQMCTKAGIDIVPPHAIRRTFITHGEKRGEDLSKLQGAVGHASVTTTERYKKENLAADSKVGNRFADLAHA